MQKTVYNVSRETKANRLDAFISSESGLTRSHIQKLIKQELVTVNSHPEKAGYKIKEGDRIELIIPDEPEGILVPEDIPLDIIWEDKYIIVVNKPPHMVIYPAAGNKSGTLMNALISGCEKLSSIGAPLRPGIVHRLDKDTSGLIVIAKDDMAYYDLVKQFKNKEIEKQYLALLYGGLKTDRGEIKTAIGRSVSDRKKMSTKTRRGKEAITRFEVLQRFNSATLAKVRILTGRTHQIRVHFASVGHPVLGDKTYGKKTSLKLKQKTINFSRQMLHACSLKLSHPASGEILEFSAPLPEDMEKAIEEIFMKQNLS
ncbi:MAG TPA: RluA family pseudouridine synthase [Nitrospirae bacterium]|nr:ribosomal large subunit pseudouridine synthase D [bacterium BMS3Abin06]HDH12254.1 RluA family pseudouridine synthase [Nitrospirota bacterium]HDZ01130.1 RluA family pseudouridine synthase [Nitrospirota bacterium]